MIFKAWESDQSKFLSLPESGMGYQIIEAKLLLPQYSVGFAPFLGAFGE